MNKKLLILIIISCMANVTKAQDKTANTETSAQKFWNIPYAKRNSGSFGKDHHSISFSYGFPNLIYYELNLSLAFYYNTHSSFGPLTARYEFAVRDDISIAPFIQYANQKWVGYFTNGAASTDGDIQANGFGVGGIGLYHFNKLIPLKKLDVYVGLGIAILYDKWTAEGTGLNSFSDTKNKAGFISVLGARYYFSKGFAGYIEAGGSGYSNINLGFSFLAR